MGKSRYFRIYLPPPRIKMAKLHDGDAAGDVLCELMVDIKKWFTLSCCILACNGLLHHVVFWHAMVYSIMLYFALQWLTPSCCILACNDLLHHVVFWHTMVYSIML